MGPHDLLGTSAFDSDPDVEEILVQLDPYIVAEVEKQARRSSNLARPEVLDLEIDEIIQRVRIKFWGALQEKHIEYPKAYIRTIVSNEFKDIPRRRRAPLPLLTDEEGELHQGAAILTQSEGMSDPAHEFEQKERLNEWIALAAFAVSALSPRQQQAMICLLKERVDNRIRLVDAFKQYKINIDTFEWPDNKVDETRLKASISVARHKIALRLGILLSEYKQRGITGPLHVIETQVQPVPNTQCDS